MTRILYTITLAETGGAQGHLRDLAQLFGDTDAIGLAVGEDGPLANEFRSLGCEVFVVPALGREINVRSDIRAIQHLRETIRHFQPDVIHAHSSKAGLLSRIAGRLESVPVLFTAHGWVFAPGAPRTQRVISWLSEFGVARLGGTIVCLSQFDRGLANEQLLVRRSRLATIPHGLNLDGAEVAALTTRTPAIERSANGEDETQESKMQGPEISGRNRRSSDLETSVLMVARFQEQKDHETLLKAFALLPESIHLHLAGTGPLLDSSQELARELGITNRVQFLGNRSDIPELLCAVDVFVLLSRYEGLPISIMEAMRAGLPVVATDVCGVSEQVAHEVTGLLVPIGDINAAAAALLRLASDPAERIRMGEAGRQKFLDHYTHDTMRDRYELLYQRTASVMAR